MTWDRTHLQNISHDGTGSWSVYVYIGGARGVMVIDTGYGHGDTSSIPGQDWLHFT